jgi:hypothetical protein
MNFFYRISDNSYQKKRLDIATKEFCFLNFCKNFPTPSDTVFVIADNVNAQLKKFLIENLPKNAHLLEVNTGSNGASFKLQLQLLKQISVEDIVVFQEDDYLFKSNTLDTDTRKMNNIVTLEGLNRADYISLYDHPDKYMPPANGGNPAITDEGVEKTGIFLTPNSHWKYTNSTTLTFAAKAKTILEDLPIWLEYCGGNHPHDYQAFMALQQRGRRIATPIPGLATHTETAWLSPLFDWSSLKDI